MIKHISIGHILVGAMLSFIFLYSSGIFIAEEYVTNQPEAYVTGATPSTVISWEMY